MTQSARDHMHPDASQPLPDDAVTRPAILVRASTIRCAAAPGPWGP
jgi:hypothetical protein